MSKKYQPSEGWRKIDARCRGKKSDTGRWAELSLRFQRYHTAYKKVPSGIAWMVLRNDVAPDIAGGCDQEAFCCSGCGALCACVDCTWMGISSVKALPTPG